MYLVNEKWEAGDPDGPKMIRTNSSKIDVMTGVASKLLQPAAANSAHQKADNEWKLNVSNVRLSNALILPVLGMLISQDRDRIYTSFAYPTESYIEYLNDATAPEAYLKIQEYSKNRRPESSFPWRKPGS